MLVPLIIFLITTVSQAQELCERPLTEKLGSPLEVRPIGANVLANEYLKRRPVKVGDHTAFDISTFIKIGDTEKSIEEQVNAAKETVAYFINQSKNNLNGVEASIKSENIQCQVQYFSQIPWLPLQVSGYQCQARVCLKSVEYRQETRNSLSVAK